jgi:hypothetical protein
MPRTAPRRRSRQTWRCFEPDLVRALEDRLERGEAATCPCCTEPLVVRPVSRFAAHLPLDATGYDLECRGCRRFVCRILHTPRSVRLLRMRRLVAAVAAAAPRPKAESALTAA